MFKLLISKLPILVLPLVLGSVVSCGDGDGDGDSFDNQGACEDFINAYNALDCVDDVVMIDAAMACSGYTDTTVSCANIFNCWTDNMACEDLGSGVETPTNYTEGCPTACG